MAKHRYTRDETLGSLQWRKLVSEGAATNAIITELRACSSNGNLASGRQIHAEAVEIGNDSCIFVANSLVSMYAKCRSLAEACQVFDSIKHPDVVSWNVLILGYPENGEGLAALDLFARMKRQGCLPNSRTFVASLKAYSSLALEQGGHGRTECKKREKQLHSEVGCHLNLYVQNTLVDMYAKCASMAEARLVFDDIKHPNVVSWTALIMGYADNGKGGTALDLFGRMRFTGPPPNGITFVRLVLLSQWGKMEEKNV